VEKEKNFILVFITNVVKRKVRRKKGGESGEKHYVVRFRENGWGPAEQSPASPLLEGKEKWESFIIQKLRTFKFHWVRRWSKRRARGTKIKKRKAEPPRRRDAGGKTLSAREKE